MLSAPLLALQALAQPVPAPVHTFGDWSVACDNGGRCQAVSLAPESGNLDGEEPRTLLVEREPGADAPVTFRLVDLEGTPAVLLLDMRRLPLRLDAEGGDVALVTESPQAFAYALAWGRQLEAQDASGRILGRVSLEGLRGALTYMDEAQGRLATPTALLRRGSRPFYAALPSIPTVRIAPPAAEPALGLPAERIAQLRRDSGCTIDEVGGPDEFRAAALGGGRTLVLLACGSGAYNISYVAFVARSEGTGTVIEPAMFDLPLSDYEREAGRRTLVNAVWDPARRRMDDFSRGRGLGDCGTRSSYAWDGAQFRLVHREEMEGCRGSITYVTTWRTEVRD